MASFRGPTRPLGPTAPAASSYGRPVQQQSESGPPVFRSDLLDELQRTVNHNAIVNDAPAPQFRLGYFDVAFLVINRMIGTGIFNSPTTVIKGTQSAGAALLLWFFGIFYALAGVHVYIEYGLSVPRFVIEGVEQAVPRSGGDLHYLQFVYRWLYYKKDTVLYSGCLYGISFIVIGNMASNCINFGSRVLQAANPGATPDNGGVRGVAIAAAAFACVIHAVSRRGGILLNNFLALVKVGILLIIIITTLAVVGGAVKDSNGDKVPNVFGQNLDPKVAFNPPVDPALGVPGVDQGSANGYAAAFLSIIFAYSGFDQNNYVLGEIARPRRIFPRATSFGVLLVAVLYMIVNVCYMAVVPAHEQSSDVIALLFFRKAFDFAGPGVADRIFNAFLALSSFGNIIVMTYTASRMKQEIAKQGFLPFRKFLGQNIDLSVGRFMLFLRKRGWNLPRWLKPEQHQEPTPVGALTLHLASCIVLIFATYGVSPANAYDLLNGLYSYVSNAFFGSFLALGILILRTRGPPATESAKTKGYRESFNPESPTYDARYGFGGHGDAGSPTFETSPPRQSWRSMTGKSVIAWLSVLCACIYLVGNAFPMLALWIPNTAKFTAGGVQWWIVPGLSFIILGFSSAWWVGFLCIARYREKHQQKNLIYEVRPEFAWADPIGDGDESGSDADHGHDHHHGRGFSDSLTRAERRQRDGGKVLVKETVLFSWEGGEMHMFHSAPHLPVDYAEQLMQQPDRVAFSRPQHGDTTHGARLQRRNHHPQPASKDWRHEQAAAPPPRVNEFAGTDFEGFGPPSPLSPTQRGDPQPGEQYPQRQYHQARAISLSPSQSVSDFGETDYDDIGPTAPPPVRRSGQMAQTSGQARKVLNTQAKEFAGTDFEDMAPPPAQQTRFGAGSQVSTEQARYGAVSSPTTVTRPQVSEFVGTDFEDFAPPTARREAGARGTQQERYDDWA
ncbi:amino acid permease-domain-containing protein [Rhypophila decipiens]|uniref:Amino acid permease-domain-containing protein n=1 Tax=Rhypophila decipiens TaxID=261697 RepID=A0AAN6Y0M4_9PEZI|nr:amino acid permease-domain-containing protein [Rhypophila decipiens]